MIRVLHFPGLMDDGGVETVIMNWYRRIDRTKIQFDFMVPRSFKGKYDDEIKALGGRIITIPRIQDGVFKYLKSVSKIIQENGPYAIAHIHAIHSGLFSVIACKISHISSVIYHAHSSYNLALDKIKLKKIIEPIFRFLIKNTTDIRFACSKIAGNFVFGRNNFTVFNNAIDLSVFTPKKGSISKDKLGLPSNGVVLGNVARFAKGKNQKFIIQLLSEDKAKGGNLYGVFVGDGPMIDEIKEFAIQLGCIDRIYFAGMQKQMSDWYNIMDVFCLPSDFEGLPLVGIEAQACGIPCITSYGVTEETNQGCVEYRRLSLNDSKDKWLTSIYEISSKKSIDKKLIETKMSKNGYNINSQILHLENIYLDCFKL